MWSGVGYGLAAALTGSVAALFAFERYLSRNERSFYSLSDKVVVITGATSGIGESLAYEIAQQHNSASLFLVGRRGERLLSVAAKCHELGCQKVTTQVADVGNREENRHLIERCVEENGRIDVLVLNAGTPCNALFNDLEEEEEKKLREVFEVNFWGCVDLTYFALSHLKESKGVIVPISSLSTRAYTPGRAIYAASKSAVNSFFSNLRTEISKYGIGVTIIQPGYVITEFHSAAEAKGNLKRNLSVFMTSDVCAKRIVSAITNCEREHQMGGAIVSVGTSLQVGFPRVHDYLALRKAESGVSVVSKKD